jgi:predicted DsbA family dithiol-disulfide isomerase
MPAIEVFADVCCPFTHVGLRRLVEQRAQRAAAVAPMVVRAWPLELVNGAPLDGELIATEVAAIRDQVAPDLFAGFARDAFPASSLPALALTAAAYRSGPERGERVALALRWALFEEGRDVGEAEVLAAIAAEHGIDAVQPADQDQVVRDWEEGRERGVIGSPHFIVGAEGFFCPGLQISHEGARFDIRADHDSFRSFVERALG